MTLPAIIFEELKHMDAEARPLPDGTPTGLRGYYAFRMGAYREGRGSAWENTWTERLAELLPRHGFQARCQCRYPELRKTCDLVVSGREFATIWIEAKGSWRSTIDDSDYDLDLPNPSFKKHLFTAAEDVTKLRLVQPAHASHLGFLLIGFDTGSLPILEGDLTPIRDRTIGWREAQAEWNDQAWRGRRVRCWFWWTSIASAPNRPIIERGGAELDSLGNRFRMTEPR